MIGLSFLDQEFPQEVFSRGVKGCGDTMLLHVVVGLLELPFCRPYIVLLESQGTVR